MKNSKEFVHLHVHSEYSLLDGATKIEQMLDRCKELNMPAVAVTDHGNMYCAWKFFHSAKNKDIKPIIGCEFYVCDNLRDRGGDRRFEKRENHHLILLAKNNVGYYNLCRLNAIAWTDGFYRKPRIDFDTLVKYSDGLICLSACIAGEVPRAFLDNTPELAYDIAKQYKNLFGEDYYIELQDHAIPEERQVMPQLIQLANKLGIKLVVTNDVHYLNREDSELQDILLCVQTGRFYDDPDRMKFFGDSFYLKSYDEMLELFPNIEEALQNTIEIANKCNVELTREDLIPLYETPDGTTQAEFFRNLIEKGLQSRYKEITPEIRDRVEYEFSVIDTMGYIDYYLIVWDFINYAKTNDIPVGPGRGSGAGSVIAYAIGITDIEPFKYNLLFERFLNPNRKTMPDFDVDFCMDRRQEVIDYVYNKYGEGKVSQIVTFGSMKAKNAIRDVGRVLRLPISESNRLSKLVPDNWRFTLNHLLGFAEFKDPDDKYISTELVEAYKVEPTRHILDMARKLDGLPRNTGMHAAGVVICRHRLSDHVPMQTNANKSGEERIFTTQFTMGEAEEAGLLKMDFLGLKTLTDIKKACNYVKENYDIDLDYSTCTYDDPEVFKTIASGDTMCIFQLESDGMSNLMKRMQPDGLEDVIAGISLYRPGPMQFIDKYIEGKFNKKSITYTHEKMAKILDVTNGCIVYQEQVMQIVRELAGFSTALADNVRYAMSKKKTQMMEDLGKLFINGGTSEFGEEVVGCINNGIPKEIAEEIYQELFAFSQYAFNKSHAACYAAVTYQTAHLKTYYIKELICAMLNNLLSDMDKLKKYLNYAQSVGISILPPDINKSSAYFKVEDGNLRFGLGAIKNIGLNAIDDIVKSRNARGEFLSMKDFFERCSSGANKRYVENFIKGGAFDCFGRTRADMMQWYQEEMNSVVEIVKKRESGQISIFDMAPELAPQDDFKHDMIKEYSKGILYGFEKEVLGFYMSGSPLDDYDKYKVQYNFNFDTSMLPQTIVADETDGIEEEQNFVFSDQVNLHRKSVVVGGIIRNLRSIKGRENNMMGFGQLEDKNGTIEFGLFPPFYERNKALFAEDAFVIIKGTLADNKEGSYKLNVREMINPNTETDTPQTVSSGTTLWLKMEMQDNDLFQKILSVLSQYEGSLKVKLNIGKKVYELPNSIRKCNGVEIELKEILGSDNVVFVTK